MTLVALAALLDIVHLKNGGRQEGKVTDLGESLRIERGPGVSVTIMKSDVREVVPCKYIPEPPRGTRGLSWGPRHLDAARAFRFDPPAGWTPAAPGPRSVAGFSRGAERFDVWLQRDPAGLAEAVGRFRAALGKSIGGAAIEEGTLHEARVLQASTAGGGSRRYLWVFVAASGDRIFTLAYAAPAAAYAQDVVLIREAALTLKGLPERPLGDEQRAALERHLKEGAAADPRAAVEALLEARALADDWAPLRLLLAQAYAARGSGPEAEAEFKRALELDPADARAAGAYARFLNGKTDYRGAAALLDPLTEAHPLSVDAHVELARAFLGLGKPVDAQVCAAHAARLDRANAEARYLLGLCHQRQGDANAAREALRAAVALDPSFGAAREALEKLGGKP
jgi:tetratricopeptide (TPR) repeat protein